MTLTQVYTYEILINFLNYINKLYGLAKKIEKLITNKIDNNSNILNVFICGLIAGNIVIVIICLMMFRIFEKIANIKLNAFDKLIKNQQVIDNLQEKISIITELAKLNN